MYVGIVLELETDTPKSRIGGTVRLNLVEVGRVGLHPRLMTKHSPFSHMKPGPGFLDHPA